MQIKYAFHHLWLYLVTQFIARHQSTGCGSIDGRIWFCFYLSDEFTQHILLQLDRHPVDTFQLICLQKGTFSFVQRLKACKVTIVTICRHLIRELLSMFENIFSTSQFHFSNGTVSPLHNHLILPNKLLAKGGVYKNHFLDI